MGALSSPTLTSFTIPIQQSSVATTGIAILNLSGSPNTLTLQLRDPRGVQRVQDTLTLPAYSQTAFVVTERAALRAVFCPNNVCIDFTGSLSVTSGGIQQPVAAMVVGSNRGQIYSLPVLQSPL